MANWTTVHDEIDRLLHDAEHADAGADFAQMMMRMQPGNTDHPKYAAELAAKATDLKKQAAELAEANGIDINDWGPDGWEPRGEQSNA